METTALSLPDTILEKLALNGDVSGLKPAEKVAYYKALCQRVGLDASTQPFKLLRLSGKEVFYCDRGGAAQLNRVHGVSHTIVSREVTNGCYVVTCRASMNGRHLDSIGAVPIEGLKGEALCNAYMKSETKAKRRATLDLLGLGCLDETEIHSIPGAEPVAVPMVSDTAEPEPQPDAPKEPAKPVHPKPTAATLAWALKALVAEPGGANRDQVHNFLTACDILPAEKQLEQWPLEWVPGTHGQLRELGAAIADFATGGQAHMPYSAWIEPVVVPAPAWQAYVIPSGKLKDTALGQLPHDELFTLWKTYQPKPTYKDKKTGKQVPFWPEAVAEHKAMRDALDQAGKEKGFDQPAS